MPTPSLAIRPAHTGDFHRVRGLLISSYVEYRDCLPADLFAAYLVDLVDLERRTDHGEILVAGHNGAIVGTVTFYPDASDESTGWPATASSIRALAVRPSLRGLGIGGALLDVCLGRAQRRGSAQVYLHTAPFMEAAMRLYESIGFMRVPAFDVEVAERLPSAAGESLVISAYALDLASTSVSAA
jgi:ribosomal protein S18 acetylase RimI-like enzyme